MPSISDAEAHPFDGAKAYRLTVPADVPVEQYWSPTACNRQTHALIGNLDAVFEPQTHGIAMPAESPYRKAVDVAVLETIQDDRWKQVLFRYLGEKQ